MCAVNSHFVFIGADAFDWQTRDGEGPKDDPRAVLHAHVKACGITIHLEAYASSIMESGIDFATIAAMFGVHDGWNKVLIEGREYIVVAWLE